MGDRAYRALDPIQVISESLNDAAALTTTFLETDVLPTEEYLDLVEIARERCQAVVFFAFQSLRAAAAQKVSEEEFERHHQGVELRRMAMSEEERHQHLVEMLDTVGIEIDPSVVEGDDD